MALFQFFNGGNMDQGVKDYKNTKNTILLDVRSEQEYKEGHVPGSQNIPLQLIDRAESVIKDKDTPLFVYCYSGARSGQAVKMLKKMGYTDVKNIGGIAAYTGETE